MGPEVTPRARRLTCEGSDDSDPDVERGSDDASEPLLFTSKPGKVRSAAPASLQLPHALQTFRQKPEW